MANSIAPGFARVTYTGVTTFHHAMFPINITADPVQGVEPTLIQRDATEIPAVTGIGDFMEVYRGLFDTDVLFGLCEIYAVEPDTGERTFLYAFDLGAAGTNVLPPVEFGQGTLTFKTTKGGTMRITVMESVFPVNQKLRAPYTGHADLIAFSNFVTGNQCVVWGRDNAYAFAPISITVKTSDVLLARSQQ